MHIPDGFLSTPVWATLDAAAAPAVVWAARRAQTAMDRGEANRVPLLGVMGAFVFAAQMINFPVGMGTSGHLVGGTLLAVTLGPSAAIVVMTAILILQALILQDGGMMVLGANILNMAFAGVLIGYFPYRLWGGGKHRSVAIFVGGVLSVIASASLAMGELLISGVSIPSSLLTLSSLLFVLGAILEGAITVSAVRAIERLNPGFVKRSAPIASSVLWKYGIGIAVFAVIGVALASSAPDALQRMIPASVVAGPEPAWLKRAAFGIAGMTALYVICLILGRAFQRQRSA